MQPVAVEQCGVLQRDGIFYAQLRIIGQEAPLLIALHGVRSEEEAMQAFQALIKLRQAACQPHLLS